MTVLVQHALAHSPVHRPGTAQSCQLHGLLFGGLEALCRLFPVFDQDLAAAGSAAIRVAVDVREELPSFDRRPKPNTQGWLPKPGVASHAADASASRLDDVI
jgi:hypothetical protein